MSRPTHDNRNYVSCSFLTMNHWCNHYCRGRGRGWSRTQPPTYDVSADSHTHKSRWIFTRIVWIRSGSSSIEHQLTTIVRTSNSRSKCDSISFDKQTFQTLRALVIRAKYQWVLFHRWIMYVHTTVYQYLNKYINLYKYITITLIWYQWHITIIVLIRID
jgi:hypothetical protein